MSVAIDGMGNVWAGSYDNGDVYHISGTDVDMTTDPPTCRVIVAPAFDSAPPYANADKYVRCTWDPSAFQGYRCCKDAR